MPRADWFHWPSTAAKPPTPAAPAAAAAAAPGAAPAAGATTPTATPRAHHANASQSSLSSSLSELSLGTPPDANAQAPLPTDLGTLIVVVMKAKNLYNKRAISKQNPYCSVRVANYSDRTKAITRGGQAPVWDHEARFKLNLEDDCRVLKLCVFDQNGNNTEIIGDAAIPLKPAMEAPPKQGHDSWYAIHYNKRYVGEVYLEMTFYPFKKKSARSSPSGRSSRSSRSTLAGSGYANLHHSESMPALRQLDLPSYMGTRPSRSPSPPAGGRRGSRPLPQVPDESQLGLGILDPRTAPWAARLPEIPNHIPRSSSSDTIPANLPRHMPAPAPPLPPLPPLPDAPALPEDDEPPAPPRHAASVPTLPPMKTAQEDIFKQINDRYEASLFERLRPPASRPN